MVAKKKASREPHPPRVEYGVALSPSADLLKWLGTTVTKKKQARLPLWFKRKDGKFLATGVTIGKGADALVVTAIDTALATKLPEQANAKRPNDEECLLVCDCRWKGGTGKNLSLEVTRTYPDVAPRDFAEIEI